MLLVRRDILGKDEDRPAAIKNQATEGISTMLEDDEENEEELDLGRTG